MFYIVGLGNLGEKYAHTRHNIGWIVLDALREKNNFSSLFESAKFSGRTAEGVVGASDVRILYPDTYMNNSGSAVEKFVPQNEVAQLIVIHDDIDLPFGELKVVSGRGAGGNNGVKSIIEALGTNEFIRIRIGIAPRSIWTGEVKRPKGGGPLERFVLKPFGRAEEKQLQEVINQSLSALETIVARGVTEAMNTHNQ